MRKPAIAGIARLAIFVAALVANRRAATTLLVWSDTFNDQNDVNRCLADGLCTLAGTQTSVRGLFHAVVWLDLRTLIQWLGVGPTGLLWIVQVSNALAATIVFALAARLGGLLAGAVAAAVLVFGITPGVPVDGVNNSSCLPFLGAVLTVACSAVVEVPGVVAVVLAALVAAVMANVHVFCAFTGVSVACAALVAPRRRFAERLGLATIAVVVFCVATVGFAPPSWRYNLLSMLGGEPGSQWTSPPVWPHMEVTWWALLAVVAWVGSLVARAPVWAAYRRASLGALAIVLPTLTPMLIAPAFGFYAAAKYLTPIHAACATAAGLAIGCVVQWLPRRTLPRAWSAVELAAPFAVALAIAVGATLAVEHDEQVMTVDDLAAAAHLLRAERGWNDDHIVRAFATAERGTALMGLMQQLAHEAPPRPDADGGDDVATLARMREPDLPDPLPSTWRVLRRSGGHATVLVVSRALLDWRRFEVCVSGLGDVTERCEPVTWDGFDPLRDAVNVLPHMPSAGTRWTGVLRMRVSLLPHADAAAGAIFMPRGFVCGGRIVSVRGIGGTISDDRRRLTFAGAPTDATPAGVELEWVVGSRDCGSWHYDGLPPLIIEGEAADVDRLEGALERGDAGRRAS